MVFRATHCKAIIEATQCSRLICTFDVDNSMFSRVLSEQVAKLTLTPRDRVTSLPIAGSLENARVHRPLQDVYTPEDG